MLNTDMKSLKRLIYEEDLIVDEITRFSRYINIATEQIKNLKKRDDFEADFVQNDFNIQIKAREDYFSRIKDLREDLALIRNQLTSYIKQLL